MFLKLYQKHLADYFFVNTLTRCRPISVPPSAHRIIRFYSCHPPTINTFLFEDRPTDRFPIASSCIWNSTCYLYSFIENSSHDISTESVSYGAPLVPLQKIFFLWPPDSRWPPDTIWWPPDNYIWWPPDIVI